MKRLCIAMSLFFSVVLLTVYINASTAPVAGDIDLSGTVGAVDVQLVINGALGLSVSQPTDVNYNTATVATRHS